MEANKEYCKGCDRAEAYAYPDISGVRCPDCYDYKKTKRI